MFLKSEAVTDVETRRTLWRDVATQLRNRTMPPGEAKISESDRMLANPADHPGADAQRVARIKAEREKARVATLQDVLTRLRNEFIDRRMVELNRELHQPHLEDAEQSAILREREQLRQQKTIRLAPAAFPP